MKKIQLGFAVLSIGFASSSIFAAADGTITINGKIVDQTCTVGGTSGNYTVTLPTVTKSTLVTPNQTTGDTKFTVNLTSCPIGNVGVYFDNTNANIVSGRLKNTSPTAPSAATGVQVQLLTSTAQPIDLSKDRLNQNLLATNVTTDKGAANIDFIARYYSTAAATAGDVTTAITYYVVYP